MELRLAELQAFVLSHAKRFRWPLIGGAVLLLVISLSLFWYIIIGGTRLTPAAEPEQQGETQEAPADVLPRRLDGVLVPVGEEAFAPRAVMVENHPDARPVSGLSAASVVIEAPVEGGITRFLAFFDATTIIDEVGPVRSARPYYVDWANGWNADYFHVGGSPEALELIGSLDGFTDVNQFAYGSSFWRDNRRVAPHNVYTDRDRMDAILQRKDATDEHAVEAWHFIDVASSTDRGDVTSVRIPYGGSYNVTWTYDVDRGVYVRKEAGFIQKDRDGSIVEAENVIVIKTDEQVLDEVGRLRVRTTGSGEAIGYRDGKKFVLQWNRVPGQPMRFEGNDGSEFLLTRGRTWIEVTTKDEIFGGLGV
jgi:hypothetical protein